MAKTALVTGASSGIGREIARDLSARGFRVILSARREERLRELAEELGDNTRVVVCDVSDREECLRLYEETKSEKISVLVNCAGFGAVGSFDKLPLDTELKMIDTNVTAVHMLTKLFLKDFVAADRGYIMNIASSAGLMYGGPMMATYYASKAYVVSLTSAIYEELRARNSRVHVCAVCPGPVDKFGVSSITPQFCAKKALEGMFGRKLIIIPERSIKALYAGSKFAPRGIVLKVTGKVQKKKLDK